MSFIEANEKEQAMLEIAHWNDVIREATAKRDAALSQLRSAPAAMPAPRGVSDTTPGRGYYEEDAPGYDEAS